MKICYLCMKSYRSQQGPAFHLSKRLAKINGICGPKAYAFEKVDIRLTFKEGVFLGKSFVCMIL